jgi:NAD(P)-dependent dehydrogenase (short-subunit alcohol dehydrogenase family)
MDVADAVRYVDERFVLVLKVVRESIDCIRTGGALLFIGGTRGRRPAVGLSIVSALTAALPALVGNLALELAPIRVNLIAPGFVHTTLRSGVAQAQPAKRHLQSASFIGLAHLAILRLDIALSSSTRLLMGVSRDVRSAISP